ncbi:hypothetical protein SmJEL517_g03879 [Synchytrium microbalum]|uniref:Aminoglycoside phosphotransferase domain-containing protein n=1 Tax=Synchytrium microbalum TaxID=1806994 RepID=A0A507C6T7_9FUNG|nr:uncharacterized protein SmJEL517_g03879 [Synchytrium microbalum]TPX33195.1 hypothetical protein SmJEL517_g03879 [Synchytrium microbalum]
MSSETGQELTEVRAGHELDLGKLTEYLTANMKVRGPLKIMQFEGGQSNPTYSIHDADGKRYVMRKQPPGDLANPSAHRVDREYTILEALSTKTNLPVPKVYVLCKDPAIAGKPFYIMEYCEGRIFAGVFGPFSKAIGPVVPDKNAYAYYHELLDTLAAFHKVDINAVGLGNYGAKGKFYERSINRFADITRIQSQARDIRTGEKIVQIARLDDIVAWMRRNLPPDENTLVHGDYRLGNVIFDKTEPKLIAILDWELSTTGHPISDLLVCCGQFLNGSAPGHPSFEYLLQYYCKKVGRPYPIPYWDFFTAFNTWRGAVIGQGIAMRYALGQASSQSAGLWAATIGPSIDKVLAIVDRGDLYPDKPKM